MLHLQELMILVVLNKSLFMVSLQEKWMKTIKEILRKSVAIADQQVVSILFLG